MSSSCDEDKNPLIIPFNTTIRTAYETHAHSFKRRRCRKENNLLDIHCRLLMWNFIAVARRL